jgi:hypothetical protein
MEMPAASHFKNAEGPEHFQKAVNLSTVPGISMISDSGQRPQSARKTFNELHQMRTGLLVRQNLDEGQVSLEKSALGNILDGSTSTSF